MRIAFVGGRGLQSNYGGVENAIREIATRLAQTSDFDVDVYGQGSGKWFAVTEVEPGLNTVSAPAIMSRFSGNAVLAFANCLYALLVRRPQALLLFASGPSLLAILARLLRVPVIAALRGIDSKRGTWGVISEVTLRLGELSAVHVANQCTVNSLAMYEHFKGPERGLVYIPNGATDASAGEDAVLDSYGLAPDGYLLFAARLDPVKRLEVLLRAYNQLPEAIRLPLIVAGGQCRSEEYQRQIDALISEGVMFVGHLEKETLDPLMRNCAVFILPSQMEGMSNSLLAAMSRARCVLCSNIKANADVVQHEPAALFETDNVGELAARLLELCSDPALRRARGQTMRQIAVRNFSWDATVKSYRELILLVADRADPVTISD